MSGDAGRMHESAVPGVLTGSVQPLGWKCEWTVEKFYTPSGFKTPGQEPYEVINGLGNTLLNGGADVIWERLITNAPATAVGSSSVPTGAFSSNSAVLGVSTSTAASTASQTGLQGSTKNYSTLSTSVTHTTGTSTAARSAVFKASFGTTKANHKWGEWVLQNATGGRALNRKAQDLGTKTSAATWDLTVTLTLS